MLADDVDFNAGHHQVRGDLRQMFQFRGNADTRFINRVVRHRCGCFDGNTVTDNFLGKEVLFRRIKQNDFGPRVAFVSGHAGDGAAGGERENDRHN